MSDISYPKGVKPFVTKPTSKSPKKKKTSLLGFGNRGMDFESAINDANLYYQEKNLAVITKRPTPINIVKVDYTKGATITQAYFETQSTTDYNGVYDGHYIDFEAKSTRNKTSFPLANIPPQQIAHLERVIEHKGWAFFLIHFSLRNEVFLLPASYVIDFYKSRPRASIPYEEIVEHARPIKEGFHPRYDYLPEAIKEFDKK